VGGGGLGQRERLADVSVRRPSRMRAKQRVALSRVLSGKFRVTVGTMNPLTFCDFAESVATLRGSVGPPARP
jgi:hypothetical protein